MEVDAASLGGKQLYELLIDTVAPRPIAWVTSLDPVGALNLAPFSFFNGVTARPPIISISVASKRTRAVDGPTLRPKDTARNIRLHREFVVHPAGLADRAAVVASAADHPAGTDVPLALGLETAPGRWGRVPRLAAAPIALECRLVRVIEVGDPPTSLILGEVLGWHLREGLLDEAGRVSAAAWEPLARLGIDGYGAVSVLGDPAP